MGRARWLGRDVVHMVGKPDEQHNQQWKKAAYTFRVKMDNKSHDDIMMTSSMQQLHCSLPGLPDVRNVKTSAHWSQLSPPILRSETSIMAS